MSKFDLDWLLEWSFKERDEPLAAHKIHRYPAVFVPELAEKIIKTFSNEGDTVLDIFSGSGTTLLEAMKLKRHGVGIELNPLAVLITEVKTRYIDPSLLGEGFEQWKTDFFENSYKCNGINNREFWFHEITNNTINDAIGALNVLEDTNVKKFLMVCVSEIIREVSYCVHSGFKLHRDKSKVAKDLSFNKHEFLDKLDPVVKRNLKAITALKDIYDHAYSPVVYLSDSRDRLESLKEESIDLILTSPPYGDSKTTVAYGQFSTFSSEMFELENYYDSEARRLDSDLLGGKIKGIDIEGICSKSLTVKNIYELFTSRALLAKDEKSRKRIERRLKDIMSFYSDLDQCIKNG